MSTVTTVARRDRDLHGIVQTWRFALEWRLWAAGPRTVYRGWNAREWPGGYEA